jgi:putative FmdB family regulatory protein
MPIYEYECRECRQKFEQRRNFSDSDDEVKCPQCGAVKPRRVPSLFAASAGEESCTIGGST